MSVVSGFNAWAGPRGSGIEPWGPAEGKIARWERRLLEVTGAETEFLVQEVVRGLMVLSGTRSSRNVGHRDLILIGGQT